MGLGGVGLAGFGSVSHGLLGLHTAGFHGLFGAHSLAALSLLNGLAEKRTLNGQKSEFPLAFVTLHHEMSRNVPSLLLQ